MNRRGIKINQEPSYLLTDGLSSLIGYEFKLCIQHSDISEYTNVLNYLIDYCIDSKPEIKPDQTISYHSWLLKCVLTTDSYYGLWEANKNGEGFTEGVDYSIRIILEQREMCKRFNVIPSFPTFSQKIVISNGVYEGLPIEGVRYPSPNHMTGWWLTTDQYDGNVKSLMTVHYFHVVFKRPDLIKYLALPSGYRFFAGKEEDIWYDQKVLLVEN
jgi:hypothetical protein